MFWDVLSWFTFDANLLYIFNLSRAYNIKNSVITTALVALDSIRAFNPNNMAMATAMAAMATATAAVAGIATAMAVMATMMAAIQQPT